MGLGTTRTTNDRVIAVIQDNAPSLLRIARRHSLCADDAQDAYQRALEIYLERLQTVDDARAGQWLRTVCKHEAMRIRAQRQRILGAEEVPWDAQPSIEARDADERAASLERVARAAEALQGCKPDEATAILLKADGSSYAEIGELTGWTYTKVNRCLAEGRARFLRRFAAIDSGEVCAGWTGVLSAIVDGQATAADLSSVRPHLRHCSACRATLRDMYEAESALGALVPAGMLVIAAPQAVSGVVARAYEALATGLGDRVARAHAAIEVATSTKAAAVVASTAAVAAGGAAAADHVARERPARAAATAADTTARPARAAPSRAARMPDPMTPAPLPRRSAPAVTAPAVEPPAAAPERPGRRPAPARSASRSPRPAAPPAVAASAPAAEAAPEFAFEAPEAPGTRAASASAPPSAAGQDPDPDPGTASASMRPQADRTGEFGFEG